MALPGSPFRTRICMSLPIYQTQLSHCGGGCHARYIGNLPSGEDCVQICRWYDGYDAGGLSAVDSQQSEKIRGSLVVSCRPPMAQGQPAHHRGPWRLTRRPDGKVVCAGVDDRQQRHRGLKQLMEARSTNRQRGCKGRWTGSAG